jgi:integrase
MPAPKSGVAKKIPGVFYREDRKSWFARFTFVDERTGERRNLVRKAESRSAARDAYEALRREHEKGGAAVFDHERATFADLADYFERVYVHDAEIRDGRKIGGYRSLASTKTRLRVLREHFGLIPLRSLTHGHIREYRDTRLHTPVRTGKLPALASVNRELQLLRRMLNIALQESWIPRNPFSYGDKLISAADEKKRERILTLDEQQALLSECRQPYLLALVVCALDTGMRLGELLKSTWGQVDFEGRTIRIIGTHTKTLKARTVHITSRMAQALKALDRGASDELVFGITSNVKRSWEAARARVGLEDVRFHDLRHTAATTLVNGGMDISEAALILGHEQLQTTKRYVNKTTLTLAKATEIMENAAPKPKLSLVR